MFCQNTYIDKIRSTDRFYHNAKVKTCSKSDQSVSEQTKAISLFSHGYLLLHRPTSSFSSLIQEDDDDGDDDNDDDDDGDCDDDDCHDDDCDDLMMIAMIANHDANEYIFQTLAIGQSRGC